MTVRTLYRPFSNSYSPKIHSVYIIIDTFQGTSLQNHPKKTKTLLIESRTSAMGYANVLIYNDEQYALVPGFILYIMTTACIYSCT